MATWHQLRNVRPKQYRAPLGVVARVFSAIIPLLIVFMLAYASWDQGPRALMAQVRNLTLLAGFALPFAVFATAGYVPGWAMIAMSESLRWFGHRLRTKTGFLAFVGFLAAIALPPSVPVAAVFVAWAAGLLACDAALRSHPVMRARGVAGYVVASIVAGAILVATGLLHVELWAALLAEAGALHFMPGPPLEAEAEKHGARG
jgi:hypothetical protein